MGRLEAATHPSDDRKAIDDDDDDGTALEGAAAIVAQHPIEIYTEFQAMGTSRLRARADGVVAGAEAKGSLDSRGACTAHASPTTLRHITQPRCRHVKPETLRRRTLCSSMIITTMAHFAVPAHFRHHSALGRVASYPVLGMQKDGRRRR